MRLRWTGILLTIVAAALLATPASHTHCRRKGSTRRSTMAGTAWNAGLRPAQPAEGGRREGLPVPGWPLVGGNLSVRRDPYLGVADTVCRSAGHVPAFREGGRQGSARDPGVVVSGPTGRNAHDQSVCTPSPARNAAALTLAWCRVIRAGFALPRVRAGGRPRSPGGGSKPFLPLRRWPYAISSVGGGYVPRREPSRRLGPSPPRPCGPLCRPEAGVPSRPRHGAISSTRSRVHPRCRRPVAAAIHGNRWEVGVPYPHPVTSINARALRVTGIPVSRLRCLGVRSGP